MGKGKHSKKEIDDIIKYFKENGWSVVQTKGGHVWGKVYCPYHEKEPNCGRIKCLSFVYSTPQNPGNHAKKLKKIVDSCVMHKGVRT